MYGGTSPSDGPRLHLDISTSRYPVERTFTCRTLWRDAVSGKLVGHRVAQGPFAVEGLRDMAGEDCGAADGRTSDMRKHCASTAARVKRQMHLE